MSSGKISSRVLASISKPQNVFLILELMFGLLFVFVTPPALVGDEPNHFFRAYQISEGQIVGEKQGNLSGGWLPESVLYTNRKLVGNIEMHQDVKFDTNLIQELLSLPLNPDKRVFERFPNTVLYTPIPYIPQIIGILVGKLFNASPLVLIYLARIVNLLFFNALAFFAIKKTPVHKWVFCLLCLTPTNVFQVSSASVDAFTYGICFLTISCFLFYALEHNGKLKKTDLVIIFALSLLAVLSKQAYLSLPLLYLIMPRRKFNTTTKYFAAFSALLIGCFVAVGVWSSLVKTIYLPYRSDIPIDPQRQAAFIMSHPLSFIEMVVQDYIVQSPYYFKAFFGQLTWLDLYVPTSLTIFVFAVLILVAILDKDSDYAAPKFGKFIFLLILAFTAFLISALLYMTWSPIGGNIIEGIQGRYFIPVSPLFFLLFYNRKIEFKNFNRYVPVIVYLTVLFSLVVTLETIYYRYYI